MKNDDAILLFMIILVAAFTFPIWGALLAEYILNKLDELKKRIMR